MHRDTVETPGFWFSTICKKNGLNPSANKILLLERYVGFLLEWNKKLNLISRRDEEQVWSGHILHSIAPLFKMQFCRNPRIMDLGTGGGLPGIPLKAFLPDSEILLVDSTRKKILAVQDMIGKLGLQGIDAVWGRAEDLAHSGNLVSHFDYIVARAVASLSDLIKWSIPFVRRGAIHEFTQSTTPPPLTPPALIALKGGDLDAEVTKAKRSGTVRSIEIVNLVFQGSEEISSIDKKIVIVKL